MRRLTDERCDVAVVQSTARQAVAAEVATLLAKHGSEVSGRFAIVKPGRVRIGRAH